MATSMIKSHDIIIEDVTFTQIGSIAAGGSDTITKDIPTKEHYTPHVITVHLSSGAINSWSKMTINWTQNYSDNTISFGVTNNHTSALNPSTRCVIAYIHE